MNALRITWTLVFALLQSVVPLLHAHAGAAMNTGVHVHWAPRVAAEQDAARAAASNRTGEAVAIGVGDSNKRDAWTMLAVSPSGLLARPLLTTPELAQYRHPHQTNIITVAPSLRLPPPHAPPVRAT